MSDPSLEDLFTEVQLAATPPKHRRSANVAERRHLPETSKSVHDLYVLPENWTRTRGVALIHDDTNSVLGNFSEYIHKTQRARKLVREESVIAINGVIHVSGSWWIGIDRKPEPARPWHEERRAMIALHLPELNVFAPLVEVVAKIEHQGIARCELAQDSEFADPDGRTLLTLPKGTNVLPVMTLDGKITLRQEIGL